MSEGEQQKLVIYTQVVEWEMEKGKRQPLAAPTHGICNGTMIIAKLQLVMEKVNSELWAWVCFKGAFKRRFRLLIENHLTFGMPVKITKRGRVLWGFNERASLAPEGAPRRGQSQSDDDDSGRSWSKSNSRKLKGPQATNAHLDGSAFGREYVRLQWRGVSGPRKVWWWGQKVMSYSESMCQVSEKSKMELCRKMNEGKVSRSLPKKRSKTWILVIHKVLKKRWAEKKA